MFCEVNAKAGLMKMVNGGSKKDNKADQKKHQKAKEQHAEARGKQTDEKQSLLPTV